MNRMSIRHQILFLLILMSSLSIVIIGGTSLYIGTNALKTETIDKTGYVLDSMKSDFEKNIVEADKVLKTLESITLEQLSPGTITDLKYLETFVDAVAPTVEREAQNHTQSHTAYIYINPNLVHKVFDVYYADQDGNGEVEREAHLPIEYYENSVNEKNSKSWWFGPLETQSAYWTEPYEWTFDNGNKAEFVSYTKPIYMKDRLFAVIGTDMNYDFIQNSLNAYNAKALGSSFLLTSDMKPLTKGMTIEHWQLDEEAVRNARLNGYTEINSKYGKKMIFLKPLSNGWFIGIEIEEYKIYSSLFRYMGLILSVMLLSQMVFILLAIRLSDYITDPILDIVLAIHTAHDSMYALEINSSILKRKDEVGALARSLEKMSSEIHQYIETVKKQSEKISNEMLLRKEVENQLSLIMRILEHADNGVFILDDAYKILYANKTFTEITGYEVKRGENTLGSCGIYLSKSQINQLNSENAFQDEVEQLKANNEVYPMYIYMTRIIESEIYYLGLFKDLTDVKLRDQKLNYLKHYDALTKLPNKVLFIDLSEKMIQMNSTIYYECIVINIDNFRLLNGILGVQNCDKIIVEIANRLRKIKFIEGVLARTEGDEFSVFYRLNPNELENGVSRRNESGTMSTLSCR